MGFSCTKNSKQTGIEELERRVPEKLPTDQLDVSVQLDDDGMQRASISQSIASMAKDPNAVVEQVPQKMLDRINKEFQDEDDTYKMGRETQ